MRGEKQAGKAGTRKSVAANSLQAMNPDFPSLYPDPETLQIFGVVTAFIHKTRRAD